MLSEFGPSTWLAVFLGAALAVVAFVPVAAHRYRAAGRLRLLDLVVLLLVAMYSMALWTYTASGGCTTAPIAPSTSTT